MLTAYRRLITIALMVFGLTLGGSLTAPAQAADTGVITGRVLGKPAGGTATPLADASVHLYEHTENNGRVGRGSVTTDAAGGYTFTALPAGDYELRIYDADGTFATEYYDDAWGYYDAAKVVVGTGTVTLNDIVLEPAGWLTGRVTDQDGAPLADSSVTVRESSMAGGYSVRTDANGYYDTRDDANTETLIPGSYLLESSGPDSYDADDAVYQRREQAVTVTAGAGTTANLQLNRSKTVVFSVVDADGAPVVHAPVDLRLRWEAGDEFDFPQYGPIGTDDEGKFRATEIHADGYKLAFHPEDGAPGVSEWFDGADGAAKESDALIVDWPASAPMKREFTVTIDDLSATVPTISGTARSGSTLTATSGIWTPAGPDLTYQWFAGTDPIDGETGSTLDLTDAQIGSAIRVVVTGTHDGQSEEATSAATAPVEALLVAGTPSIAGTPRVGATLTAKPGTWAPAEVDLTYQWLANGAPIPGATATTLLLTDAHVGRRISVQVTGAGDGQASSKTSVATAAVVGVLTGAKPTIKGKAKVGKKLKAKVGAWGPRPVTLTYTWLRNGKVIKGATKANYKLTGKDRGKKITVRVTGTRSGYVPLTLTSAKTVKVKR